MSRRDDSGAAMLALVVVMTGLVVSAGVGLVVDGGRIVTARRHVSAVAFQAARAGAQEVDEASLIEGRPTLDSARATERVNVVVAELAPGAHVTSVTVDAARVDVVVARPVTLTLSTLFGGTKIVQGRGVARLAAGVTREGD